MSCVGVVWLLLPSARLLRGLGPSCAGSLVVPSPSGHSWLPAALGEPRSQAAAVLAS